MRSRALIPVLLTSVAFLLLACDDDPEPKPDTSPELDQLEDTDQLEELDLLEEVETVEEVETLEESDEAQPDELEPDELEEEELPPPCLCEEGQCGTLDCGTECGACANGFDCNANLCERRCDQTLELGTQLATIIPKEGGFDFRFSGVTQHAVPYDSFVIEYSHLDADGPVPSGMYDAAFSKFEDCEYCTYIRAGVGEDGGSKLLIPVQGQLEIRLMSNAGGFFSANLSNVVFAEVAYYSETKTMPLVKDGLQVCVSDLTITVPVEKKHEICAVYGTGAVIGDNIADFQLQNCHGEWVNLHSFCGNTKAVWLVAVATWCSACKQYVPLVQEYYEQTQSQGLEVRYILGEDGDYGPPDLEDCMTYAKRNNVPPEMVLIDWSFQRGGWTQFFSHVDPFIGPSGQFGIPWEAVLDGRNMSYAYSETAPNSPYNDINAVLNALLSAD